MNALLAPPRGSVKLCRRHGENAPSPEAGGVTVSAVCYEPVPPPYPCSATNAITAKFRLSVPSRLVTVPR